MESHEFGEDLHQARRPTFMGGATAPVVTRALFATVQPGQGKTVRSAVRSVLRRAPLSSDVQEPPAAEIEPPPEPQADANVNANALADQIEPLMNAPAPPVEASAAPHASVPAHLESQFGPPMPAEFLSPSTVPLHTAAAVDYAERLAAGVSALRMTSERLAEQARSDALELALLVARRIVETELSTNIERFFTVIRSVIRRAGESQRVVVRLHPEDAARVEAAGGTRALSSMAVAQIQISGDADLELGDCMVEADFGVVDGRLNTRLEEMRRLLLEAVAEES